MTLCEYCSIKTVHSAPSDKVDCSKVEAIIDDLGALQGMTTLNDKYKLATTPDEFAARCNEQKEAIKTLKLYNNECFTALTKQVVSTILRTRQQMIDEVCAKDSKQFSEAVVSTKCIADNAIPEVKDAERKMILGAQAIYDMNIADDTLRMRRACCAVLDAKNLFLNAAKAKCPAHEKMYSDYVDSYTSEAFGLICSSPDKLECAKLEPLKLDGISPKHNFFLNPTIKLVKTLDH